MASELERLERLYGEMGDEHLRELAEEPEELTDDARLALGRELRRPGMSETRAGVEGDAPVAEVEEERQSGFGAAIPGVVPAGASEVEQALEPGGEVRAGMARLLSFYDGHELGRACAELDGAGVGFAIEEVAGDAMSGLPPHFEVWVEADEQEEARVVLRARLGLFPLAELEGGEEFVATGEMVVAEFDARAEAESVRAMLAGEGFAARVEMGGADEPVQVLVPAAEQERALELVAERMGLA